MKILDLSAGNRGIWFNKENPLAMFLDKRESVKPTIVCDTTNLPKSVGKDYDLVVFDPPHMTCGPKSDMSKAYGYHTTKDILATLEGSAKEAHRVTKPNAIMALKWSDHDIRLQRVIDLMPQWEPLFGHKVSMRTKHKASTYWIMLRRLP